MSWLDALIGKVFNSSQNVELEGGLNFTGGLQAVRDAANKIINVSIGGDLAGGALENIGDGTDGITYQTSVNIEDYIEENLAGSGGTVVLSYAAPDGFDTSRVAITAECFDGTGTFFYDASAYVDHREVELRLFRELVVTADQVGAFDVVATAALNGTALEVTFTNNEAFAVTILAGAVSTRARRIATP